MALLSDVAPCCDASLKHMPQVKWKARRAHMRSVLFIPKELGQDFLMVMLFVSDPVASGKIWWPCSPTLWPVLQLLSAVLSSRGELFSECPSACEYGVAQLVMPKLPCLPMLGPYPLFAYVSPWKRVVALA
jgi:hypothetical protein